MAEFGVSISNKFAFLDDDAPAPKKEVKPVKKEEKPKPAARPENTRGERSERNGNDRGNRGRGGGGRGRGGERGRGRGGGKGGRGGKREFDRHSGTGRDKSVRKEGHGRFGWGEEGDENRPRNNRRRNEQTQEEVTEPTDEAAKTETTGEETTETPVKTEEQAPAEPEEPEDTSVTYEEFIAKQEANKVDDDNRQVRAIEVNDKFKGVEIAKEEFECQIELNDGAKQLKKTRKAAAKKNVSLDEFVSTAPTGRGRGRGRGGKGGKGGRGYRPPTLDDSHFPKLG